MFFTNEADPSNNELEGHKSTAKSASRNSSSGNTAAGYNSNDSNLNGKKCNFKSIDKITAVDDGSSENRQIRNASVKLGKIFRQARRDRNQSQNSLAEAADINNSYYCLIEKGLSNLSVVKYCDICSGLKIEPDVVMARLVNFDEEQENYKDCCSDIKRGRNSRKNKKKDIDIKK